MSRTPHEKAVNACKAKGYDPKHPNFWHAVETERRGLMPHDPCRWCGNVAHEHIRGELGECSGCWRSRLAWRTSSVAEARRHESSCRRRCDE